MEITEKEFEIEGTKFFITPLGAMEGFALLEEIRVELGDSIDLGGMRDTLQTDTSQGAAIAQGTATFARTIMRLRPEFVERVRSKLFSRISFQNANAPSPQPLIGFEEVAIKSPFVPYELLVRSLGVNFMTNIPASVSGLVGGLAAMFQSPPEEPTPTSQPLSMPDSPAGPTAGTS